jgi:spore coat polysaccharide biosynthesis predicted glycosyltransferase SpsG/CMP-N-acetylneuraminic acid synthetase
MEVLIVIPAVKKNVVFTNDLVKQLAGISLVQRVIDKAKALDTFAREIYLITDSEEISLIGNRNKIKVFYNRELRLQSSDIINSIKTILLNNKACQDVIILSPYSPLIGVEEIQKAYKRYKISKSQFCIPVKHAFASIYEPDRKYINEIVVGKKSKEFYIESQAFQIFNSTLILNLNKNPIKTKPHKLQQNLIEINSYQDWWVCEKLLKKKRVIFRVIGGGKFGMGHIYRSLTLAHMITDHEVRFVCDVQSKAAADKLLGYGYWLGVYETNKIENQIISLKPDLVINDILDTDRKYIQHLRDHGIKVINFEDLGSGAHYADLTINELYDKPVIHGDNILWGHEYFFVRDEFNEAISHSFSENVSCLLVTFGGADKNDFTRKVLKNILKYCMSQKIKIIIVTGPGYLYIDKLEKDIAKLNNIEIGYTHSTGVMSHIMEQAEIAITSNGRTIYELAHMNIPSIILSQHERENTHLFANELNGFVPIGVYEGRATGEQTLTELKRLVEDVAYRRLLFNRMKHFRFDKNKKKVEKLILNILEV